MFFLFFSNLILPKHRRAFVSLHEPEAEVCQHAWELIKPEQAPYVCAHHFGALNFKPPSILALLIQNQARYCNKGVRAYCIS